MLLAVLHERRTNVERNCLSVMVHVSETVLPVWISRCFYNRGLNKCFSILITSLIAAIMFYRWYEWLQPAWVIRREIITPGTTRGKHMCHLSLHQHSHIHTTTVTSQQLNCGVFREQHCYFNLGEAWQWDPAEGRAVKMKKIVQWVPPSNLDSCLSE